VQQALHDAAITPYRRRPLRRLPASPDAIC